MQCTSYLAINLSTLMNVVIAYEIPLIHAVKFIELSQ